MSKSWDIDDAGSAARAQATRALCEYFEEEKNWGERDFCTQVPPTPDSLAKTKELFVSKGDFLSKADPAQPNLKPIPADTVIRIYELGKRDDIVTIVLPAKKKLPDAALFVARDFYRCSYWPYSPS
jgi:hypothetical protein